MTTPQRRMLRAIKQATDGEAKRHGEQHRWVELSEAVMDYATYNCHGGLAWWIANSVFGALEKRGYIVHHPSMDDLIQVSPAGLAALETAP